MYPDFDTNNVEIIYFGNKNNINIVSNLREKIKNKLLPEMQLKKTFYGVLKKIYRFFINYLAWPDYSMFLALSNFTKNRNKNFEGLRYHNFC